MKVLVWIFCIVTTSIAYSTVILFFKYIGITLGGIPTFLLALLQYTLTWRLAKHFCKKIDEKRQAKKYANQKKAIATEPISESTIDIVNGKKNIVNNYNIVKEEKIMFKEWEQTARKNLALPRSKASDMAFKTLEYSLEDIENIDDLEIPELSSFEEELQYSLSTHKYVKLDYVALNYFIFRIYLCHMEPRSFVEEYDKIIHKILLHYATTRFFLNSKEIEEFLDNRFGTYEITFQKNKDNPTQALADMLVIYIERDLLESPMCSEHPIVGIFDHFEIQAKIIFSIKITSEKLTEFHEDQRNERDLEQIKEAPTKNNFTELLTDVSNCAKDRFENNNITYSERLLLKDAPESIAQNTDELNVLRNYKINWDLNHIAFLNALEKTDEFSILLENAKEWDKQEQKKKDDKEKALLKKQQRIKKFLILPTIITGAIITFLLLALASELPEDLIMFIYGYYPIMFIIVASGFKNRCKDSIWQATIVCSPAFLSLLISIVIPIIAGALSIAGVVVSLLIFEYKFIYTINPK